CSWHGYDVISATERRQHADLREAGNDTIASEAQVRCEAHVRCKEGKALFGAAPAPPAPPPVAPAVAPAVSGRPPASTVEVPPTAAAPSSCLAPPPDGGAAACGGPNQGAAGPR